MSQEEFDILITNAHILTINKDMNTIRYGFILIKDTLIVDLGSMEQFQSIYGNKVDAKEEIDANGDLVLPGFVNAHGHFAMTLFRGLADDLPLMDWLKDYIWPIEAELKPDDCFIGTQLAAIEMIQSGTTSACDMYFFEEKSLDALEAIGFRGILGYGMLDFNDPEKRAIEVKNTLNFLDYVKKNGILCSAIISPHAPNTCSNELLLEAKQLAEKHNLPLQIHLSETESEVKEVKKNKKYSPIEYLEKLDFLTKKLVAAHCVWLTDEECKILQKYQVNIAHNPTSNLKLGSGLFRYAELSKLGINIALGTDGAASNNNLSMLQEIRLASYLHKGINLNPEILPAQEALKMATVYGAKAFGLESIIGTLEIGKKADIIMLDTKTPNVWPPHNPYSLIAYCAIDSNVKTTIINGKIVMRNRSFLEIDVNLVLNKAKNSIASLLNQNNLKQHKEKQKYLL
ncbi:MAG: amidohydrolase [Candidatus Heimdallarchaeota archaeon]|nr:amidohydrolase [Candidatus Heimdallarchaeota archaeon]